MVNKKMKRPSNRDVQQALLYLNRHFSDQLSVPISTGVGAQYREEAESLVPAAKAALYLGISQKTLANWRCSGTRGLQYVQVGSRILYRQRDLDDFILNSRKSSTSEKLAGRHD